MADAATAITAVTADTQALIIDATRILDRSGPRTLDLRFEANAMFSIPATLAVAFGLNGYIHLEVDVVNVHLTLTGFESEFREFARAVPDLLRTIKRMVCARQYVLYTYEVNVDACRSSLSGFDAAFRWPACDIAAIIDAAAKIGTRKRKNRSDADSSELTCGIAVVEKTADTRHNVTALVDLVTIPRYKLKHINSKWLFGIDYDAFDEAQREGVPFVQSYIHFCSTDPSDDGGVPGSIDFWLNTELEGYSDHTGSVAENIEQLFDGPKDQLSISKHDVVLVCTLRIVDTKQVCIPEHFLLGKPLNECTTGNTGVEPAPGKLVYIRPGHEALWPNYSPSHLFRHR